MGRRSTCLPPLRQYWREMNRQQRQAELEQRAKRKARDKKRAKCRCDAYKFPHRPGGGLCRYPDRPAVRWQDAHAAKIAAHAAELSRWFPNRTAEQSAELIAPAFKHYRPYRRRYAGLRRQIARANGLHPIRDRALIEALMPRALALAKELHRRHPKYKYRNMEITETGMTGHWTSAGPTM